MKNSAIIFFLQLLALVTVVHSSYALDSNQPKLQDNISIQKLPPSSIAFDNACPFDECRFGPWKAIRDIDLLDAPKGKKIVAHIVPGEEVTAITGTLFVKPLKITVKQKKEYKDYSDNFIFNSFKPGDVFYILDWSFKKCGASGMQIWVNGRMEGCIYDIFDGAYDKDSWWTEDSSELKSHEIWWVKLKTKSNQIGWAEVDYLHSSPFSFLDDNAG